MKHQLPKLPYSYNALEPYIDAQTMEIHHTKHHQAYIDKLNAALEKQPELQEKSLEELLKEINKSELAEAERQAIKNNGGGHANHAFFWQIMGPKKEIDRQLAEEINRVFGSWEKFKELFSQTAVSHFGSGWAWLARDGQNQLKIYSTANQDSPLSLGHEPIIALDLWEHAYYLKYQNRRAEYIENWWRVLKII